MFDVSCRYADCTTYFKHCIRDGDRDDDRLTKERVLIHINSAAVHCSVKAWRKCISSCKAALEEDSKCIKAHFRKGAQSHTKNMLCVGEKPDC